MKPSMLIVLLCLISAVGCAPSGGDQTPAATSASTWQMGRPAAHPELSAQDQLVACLECHEDATPGAHEQWFESRHGIANVKCYQCHGTFENLKVTPALESCAACHADRLDHCPGDKACWACHKAHDFKAATKKKEVK